MERENELCD